MKRKKLEEFLVNYWGKEFLAKWQKKDDHGANGLQIKGAGEIKKIALGVSLNRDFLDQAIAWGADTCIFHHGLGLVFPKNMMPAYLQGRLELVFKNKLNILGYHGAMDAHPKYGHSALILKELGVRVKGEVYDGWGYYGDLPKVEKLTEIGERCHQLFNHEVFVVGKPDRLVQRVAVVTGGGAPDRKEAANLIEKGVDLYITGEIKESLPHIFSESGMSYFSCGHYATEKMGLFELLKNLKKAFPLLKTKFIDIPNPL